MPYRYYILIILFLFILQISFSIFYSSEIITQNNIYYENQVKLESLKENNQALTNELSRLTSMNYLENQIKNLGLSPINQKLDLNTP
ncbi:MAG: hypothetical protein ACOX6N_04395 [Patescibacteria group bacterium]|jgi:hypothetical protein